MTVSIPCHTVFSGEVFTEIMRIYALPRQPESGPKGSLGKPPTGEAHKVNRERLWAGSRIGQSSFSQAPRNGVDVTSALYFNLKYDSSTNRNSHEIRI